MAITSSAVGRSSGAAGFARGIAARLLAVAGGNQGTRIGKGLVDLYTPGPDQGQVVGMESTRVCVRLCPFVGRSERCGNGMGGTVHHLGKR